MSWSGIQIALHDEHWEAKASQEEMPKRCI